MACTITGRYALAPGGELKEDWAVRVDGDCIVATGPRQAVLAMAAPGDELLDTGDSLIAPGFCNSHMHAYGYLAHGIPVPVVPSGFDGFLRDYWWPWVEDRLDHDYIRAATALACVEMLKSGVTSFCDILEAPNAIPGGLLAEAEVVEQAGLRAILSFEATERAGEANGRAGLEENASFFRMQEARRKRGEKPLVRGMMCIHTTFSCSIPFLERARTMATDLGSGLQMHLSESVYEPVVSMRRYGKRPVALYDEIGFLGPDILASQCVQVSSQEIATLIRRGVRVSHMPLSNCEVGGGVAPVPDFLAAGARLGLGSDGYINNFFEVMRGAFLIHKAYRQDSTVMPAPTVVDLATRGGAAAMGLNAGELAPGRLADIIVVDAGTPTPITPGNAFDQYVLYRTASDVRHVMVGGRLVVRDGRILTLDEGEVIARAREAARRFWKGMN